ncbi:MAG: hypothetical protein JW734_00280 [Candidatus Omnitrophica bacterium]|nr:hypothetical protein [Candidatus Omnitrophota bacterium]
MRNLYILLLILLTLPINRLYGQNFSYLEKTDQDSVYINWRIEEKPNFIVLISTRTNGEKQIIKHDKNLSVLEWLFINPNTNTDIRAKRQNNIILIKGLHKGLKVERKIKIDNHSWYQKVSFSLTSFINSAESSLIFWSLRTDVLKPFKLKALKQQTENLNLEGKETKARRVKVTLSGLRSMFWHSDYWFREKDNLFIKYKGIEGPPGTPPTVITLQNSQ